MPVTTAAIQMLGEGTVSVDKNTTTQKLKPLSQPLISVIYTADPSAHY
jgi:hypothetical protein